MLRCHPRPLWPAHPDRVNLQHPPAPGREQARNTDHFGSCLASAAMLSAQVLVGNLVLDCYREWQGQVGMHKTSSARRLLPSPLWGGIGGGGREIRQQFCQTSRPPSPQGGGSPVRQMVLSRRLSCGTKGQS